MGQRVRQFVVGLLVLGVLVGVYWLYSRFGSPRTGATEVTQVLPEPLADAGDDREIGTIAGVGVRRVQNTRFAHRNEFNEVDREFGFEELLHEEGDQWEITDPYMDLYFPKFRCRVTADRGKVQVETQATDGTNQSITGTEYRSCTRKPVLNRVLGWPPWDDSEYCAMAYWKNPWVISVKP